MFDFVNFEGCGPSYRFYGGDAGRKVGVVYDGGDWLIKFPGSTRSLKGSVPSYTSSPLSEYLGSHMYGLLGIPVHETRLGVRDGKVVVGCKDFVSDPHQGRARRLVEFKELKNSISDDEPGFTDVPSSGASVVLADVRAALYRIPVLQNLDAVERFWDMFVTDAFIRNVDRNNTNWGILLDENNAASLAPVYDNGGSFFNKRTLNAIDARVGNTELIRQDALDVRSCYLNASGKSIAPLKYIASGQDQDCNAALGRFMERYDPQAFRDVLDEIPEHALGLNIITDAYREYHKQVLDYRYEHVFAPAALQINPAIGTLGFDDGMTPQAASSRTL